jgi:hypothetical protein
VKPYFGDGLEAEQLELPGQRCWLVQGPRHPEVIEGGAILMGRIVTAWTEDEAALIEREDGGEVARVLPAPETAEEWRSLCPPKPVKKHR